MTDDTDNTSGSDCPSATYSRSYRDPTYYCNGGNCFAKGETAPTDSDDPLLAVICETCGYAGSIETYLPSFSMMADCKCPKCGSTNNQHNAGHAAQIRKAWNCKHTGTLSDAGLTQNDLRLPLLKCSECGSVGLDWSMRGEPMPKEKLGTHELRCMDSPSTQTILPAHLRDDASFLQCSKCRRKSWGGDAVNSICGMIAPSGEKCEGILCEQNTLDERLRSSASESTTKPL